MSSIRPDWHPENWDAATLAWLHSPAGAKDLAAISAVWDLLAACQELVADIPGVDALSHAIESGRAAIAKALGEEVAE